MAYEVPVEQVLLDRIGSSRYVGTAASWASKSDLVWRIARITESLGETHIEWANGNQSNINSWDLRTSYFSVPPLNPPTVLFSQSGVTDSFFSSSMNIEGYDGVSIEVSWLNSVGFLADVWVQVSNDGINFTNHPRAGINIFTDDSFIWNISDLMMKYIRVSVMIGSGTSDITITANGKGL